MLMAPFVHPDDGLRTTAADSVSTGTSPARGCPEKRASSDKGGLMRPRTGIAAFVTVIGVAGKTMLPPGSGSAGKLAIADGDYPYVFNNDSVDGSFGVTPQLYLNEITPFGLPQGVIPVPSNEMNTSFSSKSEGALNLSSDGKWTFTETNAYSGNNGRAAVMAKVNGKYYYYAAGNAGNGANPQPAGVVLGAGTQIITPSSLPESAQNPGAPTPVGSFNVTKLGDPADKVGKDDNFRGLALYNNVLYYTKGSGSNGVNTVYFLDTRLHPPGQAEARHAVHREGLPGRDQLGDQAAVGAGHQGTSPRAAGSRAGAGRFRAGGRDGAAVGTGVGTGGLLVRRERGHLHPGAVAELGQDVLEVRVDGPLGHHEAGRDLPVRQALGDQRRDFALARRQQLPVARERGVIGVSARGPGAQRRAMLPDDRGQPVPRRAVGVRRAQHDRFVHESDQGVEDLVRAELIARARFLGGGKIEAIGENRQPGPQQPFGGRAQVVAPGDGRLE
jgi:hypothetical protein